ncbi:MAG: dethiobiotin synthase [Terriglobales bacterium]
MSRGVFVTGTDTGVGKTVVAAALVLALPGACYWKPIQSGIEADPATDSEAVARCTGLPAARILPEAYRLRLPASPHVSAAAEGLLIERARLALPPASGPVVTEGAGGLLVPINDQSTMLDLMVWLGLPILLVARTALGTINHTLLSLEALRRRGLEVRALVLNGAPVPSTADTLRRWGRPRQLIQFPTLPALTPASLAAAGEAFRGLF